MTEVGKPYLGFEEKREPNLIKAGLKKYRRYGKEHVGRSKGIQIKLDEGLRKGKE